MKRKNHSLKSVYREIMTEQKVGIDTDKAYYDWEFPDDVDFAHLTFQYYNPNTKHRRQIKDASLQQVIPKVPKIDKKTKDKFKKPSSQYGSGDFFADGELNDDTLKKIQHYHGEKIKEFNQLPGGDSDLASWKLENGYHKRILEFVGGSLSYFIIQVLKNVFIVDARYFKKISDEYQDPRSANNSDEIPIEVKKIVADCVKNKVSSSKTISEILRKISIFDKRVSFNRKFRAILHDKAKIMHILGESSQLATYLNHYFRDQPRIETQADLNKIKAPLVWSSIAKEYISDSNSALSDLLRAVRLYNKDKNRDSKIYFRNNNIKTIDDVETVLNRVNSLEDIKKINSDYSPANRKGRGEFLCHMLFNTVNACLSIEPDVLLDRDGLNLSVKSSKSGDARTGENMDQNVRNILNIINDIALPDTAIIDKLSSSQIKKAIKELNNKDLDLNRIQAGFDLANSYRYNIHINSFEDLYNCLKIEVTTEHDAVGIIHHDGLDNLKLIRKEKLTGNEIIISSLSNNRFSFTFNMNKKPSNKSFENNFVNLMKALDVKRIQLQQNTAPQQTPSSPDSSTTATNPNDPSALNAGFKIKTSSNFLVEGGKAGHMMHPYENFHMKISDMKRMIEDFQNDFEISEKVDGANLFFTIDPQQGKILFSRNKSDMSHEETLEKFGPDHPAHVLFTDGANAIFNSAKNSLSKQDIQKVFGQNPEGGKTYINFEIMHPQKPNQIKYDMKYIVFHAIVDYDINGNVVESSPDDERLIHLLNQLQPSFNVANNDFSLGSNLKIKLNNLSQSDVDELLNELNSITTSLGLSDDMTIADAVKSEIRSLLDRENITELLPEDKIEMIYDFITNESTEVKGTAIKKGLDRELQKTLTSLGLTSKAKAYKIIKQIIQEFRPLFILLGIKLLHNVQSRYMSSDASNKNVDELRRLLDAAMEDYDNMMQAEDLSDVESKIVKTLTPHIANVRHHGVESVVSSPVEGGVFIGKDGNTYKVTGGFAPLNQILGTAMRSLDYMPVFKEEFIDQERGS